MMKRLVYLFCVAALFAACHSNNPAVHTAKPVNTIIIQPFSGVSTAELAYVFTELKKVYPLVTLYQAIDLPKTTWNPTRKRYRADSLINYLKNICPPGAFMLGLTNKDISTTKGKAADWGVMGLGFCPGSACIASSFRLSAPKNSGQLFKVGIHELGHTQGLQHCPVATCFMKDAEGRNTTAAEISFCATCSKVLLARGWRL